MPCITARVQRSQVACYLWANEVVEEDNSSDGKIIPRSNTHSSMVLAVGIYGPEHGSPPRVASTRRSETTTGSTAFLLTMPTGRRPRVLLLSKPEGRTMYLHSHPWCRLYVQSAVNQARKMDGRLAALREELVARKDKWEAYKLEMQQAYQVERNRFSADVGRLEQEIAEMAKSQEESHRNITAAAASGTGQREHMATAVAEEWQALCASQDVPASALSQELMRMAAILSGGGSGSASAMPTTPPHRPAGGLPLTPPSVSGNGGGTPKMGTATDPYMVGTERPPEATADGATPAALGSASRAAHGQRPRPAEGGYRKAVKPAVPPAPKTAPSPSLGDKLWEKRLKEQEDARTALLPFRRRGGTEPGTHEGAENAGPDPPPVEDMHRAGTHEISEDSEMDALE